jgi:hypothetical protein
MSFAPHWQEKENWPTPNADDARQTGGMQSRAEGRQMMLNTAARSWATPAAIVPNEGEQPATWRARQAKLKEKHNNGNGAGVPLGIQAQEWATPATRDYRTPNSAESQARRKGNEKRTQQLSNQVAHQWDAPTVEPAWIPCPCCENHLCTIHEMHAHDCPCPSIEEWETDPYARGLASRPDPATETAGAPSSPPTPTSRLQLNERFVEVLMGLPPGWTDCAPSVTPSSPSKPSSPCVSSGSAPSGSE